MLDKSTSVKDYKILPKLQHYGCLIDLLGRASLFEDALAVIKNLYVTDDKGDNVARIRTNLNDNGSKRIPGCTSIEADDIVHEFLACDKSHPMSDKFYAMLGELTGFLMNLGMFLIMND
ncbi:hypothetical protein Hanom_Chr09g00768211 [Helianthus anomalus]